MKFLMYQSRNFILVTLICLISLSIQSKQQHQNYATGGGEEEEVITDMDQDELNKLILVKNILNAYKEMKNPFHQSADETSGGEENEQLMHRDIRSEKRTNEKFKELFIKRAMKNVALGFGKK